MKQSSVVILALLSGSKAVNLRQRQTHKLISNGKTDGIFSDTSQAYITQSRRELDNEIKNNDFNNFSDADALEYSEQHANEDE